MSDWLTNRYRNLSSAWHTAPWRWALLVAGASDVAGIWLIMFPPAQWILDVATAVVLLLVLGFRWSILSVLAIEAVPFLQAFPAWVLVVVALAASDDERPTESGSD